MRRAAPCAHRKSIYPVVLFVLAAALVMGISGSALAAFPTVESVTASSWVGSGDCSVSSATRANNVSSEDPASFTLGGSGWNWLAYTIAVRPASPGTTAPTVASVTPSAFYADTTTHNVAMPATVNSGDLLIALFENDGSADVTNPGGGWNSLGTAVGSSSHRLSIYYKIASGSEDGTTVDFATSSGEEAAAQVYRITGWHGTTPPEISGSAWATNEYPNPPSLNPGGWGTENTLWIVVAGVNGDDPTNQYPASYTANQTRTYSESDTTSHLVAMPATVNTGDLLIVLLESDGDATVATPGGWNPLGSQGGGPGDSVTHRLSAYYKIAGESEDGATVDFATSAGEKAAAQVYRITDWHGTTPPAISSGYESSNEYPNPPSLNPAAWGTEDTLWIVVAGVDGTTGTLNYPTAEDTITPYTGGTRTYSEGTSGQCSISSARLGKADDEEDPRSFTLAAPAQWLAYTIAVRPAAANTPPTISDITDKTTNEDTASGPHSFTVGDTETPAASLTLGGTSSDTTLVPNANITFGGSGGSRTVTVAPAANQFGTATITVTVTDADGGTASDTFVLTVTSINDVPSFTKGSNQTVLEDAGAQSVSNWATAISPGPANESSQAVNFIVTNNDNALFSVQPAVAPDGTLTYTPAPNANGAATVNVQIHDDGGTAGGGVDTSAIQTFTITVTPLNDAPTAIALSDNNVAENEPPDTTVGTFSTTDVDLGDTPPDTHTYTLVPGPGSSDNASFHISGSGGGKVLHTSASFNFEAKSSYAIRVRSTDSGGLWVEKRFTILILDVNETPVIISGGGGDTAEERQQEGTIPVTQVLATDPDADTTLTFSIIGGADAEAFIIGPANGRLSFLVAPDNEAPSDADEDNVYEVLVQVSDGCLTDTQTIFVTITDIRVFKLTYWAEEGGSVLGDTRQEVRQGGDGTPVTAVPDAGYKFLRWNDGLLTATRTDTDVDSHVFVKALFEALPPAHQDRWTDITDAQWLSIYGFTAEEISRVAGGYLDGRFRPSEPVTRAQFAKMVVAGFALSLLHPNLPTFPDVPTYHLFYEWVEGAAGAQVVTGLDDGRYGPARLITRQQANTILARYLSRRELTQTGHIQGALGTYPTLAVWYAAEGAAVLAPFSDRADLATKHAPFTAYLVYRGVVQGVSGHLNPLENLSRAQAVVLILRVQVE